MDRILVRPSGPLSGDVKINGAKNSALKLMAACTLAQGTYLLNDVPDITDVQSMTELLRSMGLTVNNLQKNQIQITNSGDITPEAPYEQVEKMRASIVVLGPLVATYGKARVALPGGDDFGPRPIDMHLKGLEALGVRFNSEHGYIEAEAEKLVGSRIVLDFPSVGATENIMMAAVRAEGETIIENAAREPEIADLAAFLNRMGAKVLGAGSSTITIEGVNDLVAVEHTVIPDRIEVATYLAAVGIAGGEINLLGARADHMDMLCQKLGEMGMRISSNSTGLWAMSGETLQSVDLATLPYPGLATDYKPFLVAMLSVADGVGIVTENLFSGRFRYVDELIRMGAEIRTEGHHAVIRGVDSLSGAPVRAHDIRAGAALVTAALKADGETEIRDPHHIDRGYEDLVGNLKSLGADIDRSL
ncbi:MAG: UDP-N-acetylglucosamine 1-carboxyvinyltransferase [Actinomycetota bacterium]|mgnify:FL=1|nr:UDP-N-acetylglucosamine 1-carboxyvinyltransferase [Actinomycetota bacterium]|tara:strand:- start:113 stop:1366 length:1254 start_codon:yes stop_codon:yes gene_type:complete